jgi:hypothetical protein
VDGAGSQLADPREQLFITMLRSGKLAESQPLVEDLLKREPQRSGHLRATGTAYGAAE